MELRFEAFYYPVVLKEDVPKLSDAWKERIMLKIRQRLGTSPDIYGKPLRRSLKGFRVLRTGDYRVVFRIDGNIVYIIAILPRALVLKLLERI